MKRSVQNLFLFVALFAISHGAAIAQRGFFLKEGDRVVFYGDSITDQRLYTTFTESYVITRFPQMNVSFVHSGWGGDRVTGGGGGPIDRRLERDVFAYKPTVVTVMLGMNDASYRPFDQGIFDTYAKGYQHIVESVTRKLEGVRMTLIMPSPFDDVTRAPGWDPGYNSVLIKYGEFVKDLAAKSKLGFADLNTYVVDATKKAKTLDEPNAQKLNPDRVHPAPGGQLLMAAALLKGWNAPSTVSRVSIAWSSNPKVDTDNTAVSDPTVKDGVLTWSQLDRSLPMPVDLSDPIVTLAVKSSDFMDTLNNQQLKITGLEGGTYALKIDGQEAGRFTKEQLGQGINLSWYSTPMMKQALQVHGLTLKHNNYHFEKWRKWHVPNEDRLSPAIRKVMDAIDMAEDEVVLQQRAAAQPKMRNYELAPVS